MPATQRRRFGRWGPENATEKGREALHFKGLVCAPPSTSKSLIVIRHATLSSSRKDRALGAGGPCTFQPLNLSNATAATRQTYELVSLRPAARHAYRNTSTFGQKHPIFPGFWSLVAANGIRARLMGGFNCAHEKIRHYRGPTATCPSSCHQESRSGLQPFATPQRQLDKSGDQMRTDRQFTSRPTPRPRLRPKKLRLLPAPLPSVCVT